MLTIKLGDIHGIHPDFSRVECELDLAPIGLPDPALIPKALATRINEVYPLVICGPDALCIGQTTLYRWLKAHTDPEAPVRCIEWPKGRIKQFAYQLVLIERLVAPALAQITRQQVRDLYANIGSAKEQWPHEYRSHAHLARLVGVKPLKGCGGEK
ncbi:hypothetical protein ACV35V_03920 [Pseudomonas aeruginosa]